MVFAILPPVAGDGATMVAAEPLDAETTEFAALLLGRMPAAPDMLPLDRHADDGADEPGETSDPIYDIASLAAAMLRNNPAPPTPQTFASSDLKLVACRAPCGNAGHASGEYYAAKPIGPPEYLPPPANRQIAVGPDQAGASTASIAQLADAVLETPLAARHPDAVEEPIGETAVEGSGTIADSVPTPLIRHVGVVRQDDRFVSLPGQPATAAPEALLPHDSQPRANEGPSREASATGSSSTEYGALQPTNYRMGRVLHRHEAIPASLAKPAAEPGPVPRRRSAAGLNPRGEASAFSPLTARILPDSAPVLGNEAIRIMEPFGNIAASPMTAGSHATSTSALRSEPAAAAPGQTSGLDIATDRLGVVQIAVEARDDALAVRFAVDRAPAASLLVAGSERLDAALAAGGSRLDALSVDVRDSGGRRSSHIPPPPPPPPAAPLVLRAAPRVLRDRYA